MTVRGRFTPSPLGATPADRPDDGVPEEVVAQARAAFGMRATGPLAALVFDSEAEGAAHGERRLRFEHPRVRVKLAVVAGRQGCGVRGWVEPPQLRVELALEGAEIALAQPAVQGRFGFRSVPHGLVRLRLVEDEVSTPVHTEWFRT